MVNAISFQPQAWVQYEELKFTANRGANIRKNHCNSIRFIYQFISLNSHRISVISHLISHLISYVISLNSLLISLNSVISPLILLNAFLTSNSIRGEPNTNFNF
jgi:hypothetical protein